MFLDILNIGNLINDDWGHIDEAAFPYSIGVARVRRRRPTASTCTTSATTSTRRGVTTPDA